MPNNKRFFSPPEQTLTCFLLSSAENNRVTDTETERDTDLQVQLDEQEIIGDLDGLLIQQENQSQPQHESTREPTSSKGSISSRKKWFCCV